MSPTANSKPPRRSLDLETGEANPVGNVSATLHGAFTAEAGIETEYFFEYGTSSNFGHKEPAPPGVVPAPAVGTQSEAISTEVENLAPNTTYHFGLCRVTNTARRTARKGIHHLSRPAIEAFATSEVTATSAVLHAKIDPEGFETSCEFEYGVSPT